MGQRQSTYIEDDRPRQRRSSFSRATDSIRKSLSKKKIKHAQSVADLSMYRKDDTLTKSVKPIKKAPPTGDELVENPTRTSINAETQTNANDYSDRQVEFQFQPEKSFTQTLEYRTLERDKNRDSSAECTNIIILRDIDKQVNKLADNISQMTHSEMTMYYLTYKDELHNSWIRAYELKETNKSVKFKKIETIDNIKAIFKMLNHKVWKIEPCDKI